VTELTSNELAVNRTQFAEQRTDLAAHRTVMAADRSLMAWVRTGLSMISFGFTLYKALQALQQAGGSLPREHSPRNIGLFLTGLGVVSIVVGALEYWQTLTDINRHAHFRIWRVSFVVALILSAAGVLLFAALVTRLL
jgi:putative membrane protein